MKRNKNKIKFMLSMVLLLGSFSAFSQAVHIMDDGSKKIDCVTEEYYQQFMRPILEQKIQLLEAEGKIKPISGAKMGGSATVPLSWPLRMTEEYRSTTGVYSYWYVSNFADLNHSEGSREDWMCFTGSSAKNYDQHNGADIVPYPFPWQMMDDESVDVIAAADGEVIHIFDGNTFDRNCAEPHSFVSEPFNGGYYGNFVALRHSDYSITVYAHLKNGTVANLEDGDQVIVGQYLGKLGSSGNSTAPHLHFEVRPTESSSYIEPWFDAEGCNDDVTESQWIDQVPYDEPQLLRITTHDAMPDYKTCTDYEGGSNETLNTANHFNVGATLYIGISMRDFLYGDNLDIDIYNSSGSVVESIDYTSFANYQSNTFVFTESLLFYSTGTYRIRVIHDGKTYDHYFTVNCPGALTLSGAQSGHKGYISGDNINSTATISGSSANQILYEAENHIKLNVGFKATENCEFIAQLNDCTIGGVKLDDPGTEISYYEINVFPNPNFGIFTLQYATDDLKEMQFFIRNTLGEIVYASETYQLSNTISETVNLSTQPKGLYFIELKADDKTNVQKIVIQ